MKNNIFTRVLALVLAAMFLVSSAVLAVGAEGANVLNKGDLTDKSITDYKETLDTISYSEYQQVSNFLGAAALKEGKLFDMTRNWVYRNGEILVAYVADEDDKWDMTVSVPFKDAAAAEAAGYPADRIVPTEGSESVYGVTYYDTIEEALSVKNEKNEYVYQKEDLPYYDSYYSEDEGKYVSALYTPGVGNVTWTLDLKSAQILRSTLVSIAFDYYPVIAKPSAIEREFAINGKAPFSEARALRFAKVWASYEQGSTVGSEKILTAVSTHADLIALARDAQAKGEKTVEGMTFILAEDGKSVSFLQPEIYTPGNTKLIQDYTLRFFSTDMNRNELRPAQLQQPKWMTHILADSDGFTHTFENEKADVSAKYTSNYFGFVLTPDVNGQVELSLKSVNEPMALSNIELLPYEATVSYADYLASVKNQLPADAKDKKGESYVKLEAENTSHSSTNVVYPVEDRASALTSPADTTRTVLNTIGTEKWATAGQWVEYTFTVDDAGWYDVYARFKQSYLDGMYVNRSLQLYTNYGSNIGGFKADHGNTAGYYNGLPFAEAAKLRYNYSTDWQVTALNSTNDKNVSYQIYLRPGVVYTMRIEVTLGSMSDMVREIERILNVLNTAYLDIIKLTGTTPDDYRDYSFYRLLPETLSNMNNEKASLEAISKELRDTANVASTYTGVCDKLVDLLRRMLVDGGSPIAKNLDTYKSYVGSLGTFLTDAKTQPLQLDYLTIQSSDAKAPEATPNFFVSFWHEMMSFIQSFFRDYNSMGATEESLENTERVNVWVPYGRDQANVIRNLSTNGFTVEEGIAVDLKLVSGGTLLPSILAGMGPDIYIGLDQGTVINYAIRGALQSIEMMDGFNELMRLDRPDNERIFNNAAMTVLKIADADGDDHYYGLPENQSFSMMFVRLDVLADLDIEIPKTWADLYIAQSVLESNNMEIGVSTEYKYFLYQMGGNLWADDGMRINLDSKVGLAAFEEMCAMFTQYSFPYTYDAANRFRTGEMPIILAGYTGLYNQLKVFATELDGCWAFVPVPGWEHVDEDGNVTINNDSISGVTAVIMISGLTEEAKAAAWKYMVWYTGVDCQTDYANEMVAIMGDSAKQSTANRDALISMPWTTDEYTELIKQFDNLASVENYPGYYFIDRYTNFAFLAAYNEGADPSAELLSYINTINTEITRKREEFGLETLELGQKLPVKRIGQATEALQLLEEKFDESAYAEAIKAAKYGIANANADKPDPENILKLQEASDLFMEALLSKWDGATKKIVKVSGEEITVPTYYRNIGKQTMATDKGGFAIGDLNELELVFFISEALEDAATALDSYLIVG